LWFEFEKAAKKELGKNWDRRVTGDVLFDKLSKKTADLYWKYFNALKRHGGRANEEVKAKKTAKTKKMYADQYYRQNKGKVKKKKKDLERSADGKVRNRMKPIMAKQRKTPTGRHKVEYNT
jgi:hypothetical protein